MGNLFLSPPLNRGSLLGRDSLPVMNKVNSPPSSGIEIHIPNICGLDVVSYRST